MQGFMKIKDISIKHIGVYELKDRHTYSEQEYDAGTGLHRTPKWITGPAVAGVLCARACRRPVPKGGRVMQIILKKFYQREKLGI
jgi:hypothetical protein